MDGQQRPEPVLRGLTIGDGAAAWRAAGFAVHDGQIVVGGVVLDLVGGGGGVRAWTLDPPVPDAVDGLRAATSDGIGGHDAPTDAGGVHPNGVTALDHLVVASPDVERTTAAFARIGLDARRTIDGARGDAQVRYRFFRLGTAVLELIGPVEATGEEPARFVGLAFTAPSLEGVARYASEPRDAVQPGRRIVTVRTERLGIGVPVAVLTPRPSRNR